MDIRTYLRDMDHEEEELRMQIMRLQIRIQQLQDARLVLMQREEERAQHLGHHSPFGSLDGGQIVVRDRAKMMPPDRAEPAKASLPAPPAPKPAAPQRLPHNPDGNPFGVQAVLALLHAEGQPLARADIVRGLGVKSGDDATKLTKTLANMRQHKYITRDASGHIVLLKMPKPKRKPRPADPERSARERQTVLDVLAKASEAMPSGDVLTAAQTILGQKNKAARDRLYWALKKLRDSGTVHFREGLYRLPSKAA